MKVSLNVFILIAFFTMPIPAFSGVLQKIPVSQIGQKIKDINPSTLLDEIADNTIEAMKKNPVPTVMALGSNSTAEMAANLLTIPVYAYNPALGAAASFVVGMAFDSTLDVKKAYESGGFDTDPALSAIKQAAFPAPDGLNVALPEAGKTYSAFGPFTLNPARKVISAAWGTISQTSNVPVDKVTGFEAGTGEPYSARSTWSAPEGSNISAYSQVNYTRYWLGPFIGSDANFNWYQSRIQSFTIQLGPADPVISPPPSVVDYSPATLDETQKQALIDAISNAINNSATSQAVKDAFKNLLKSIPDVFSQPPPITQQDLTQFFTNNTNNINQDYIDNLTNIINNTTGDTSLLQAELARAQAEKAKEEEKEIFLTITPSGFEEPYDPGDYDIPERFSSFMDTVKSSSLFSFSSSFFNSIPGGGSPIYQIEAGRYGSHTIDLSQTMSNGLAVLKTILLTCFGFLSIRAVIMKR